MTDALTACPMCGQDNPNPSARFCAGCGGSLQSNASASEVASPIKGPTREDVIKRLEEMRQNPRYKEAMGMEIRGSEVLSHRMEGRRNGFVLLVFAIVGFLAYKKGFLAAPLERFGPGPLFAVGAFALFVISRGTRKSHDLKGPNRSREAEVLAMRHHEPSPGPARPAGVDNKYYITLMDAQGVQEELSVKRSLYGRLSVGDTGAAYIKGRTLIRFEPVG